MLDDLATWIVATVERLGYWGIIFLMGLESSFVPFPSEVVMIPAGYLAAEGKMNAPLAVGCGIIGSWLGALVNYALAVWLGRPLLLKWGKFLLLNPERYAKVEKFFANHGEISTFTGRLIPFVRQYISFPAGLARMNLCRFLLFTGLGAGIWVAILAWIGYEAGRNKELWRQYSHQAAILLLAGAAVTIAIYAAVKRRTFRRAGLKN